MNSLILRRLTPFLAALMFVYSVFILLRGHDAPGGGFIAGLIAAASFAILGIGGGTQAARRALHLNPMRVAAFGLLLAATAGLVSLVAGRPFMTGLWVSLPFVGIDLSSVMLFDTGVYLVVAGGLSAIILALEEGEP